MDNTELHFNWFAWSCVAAGLYVGYKLPKQNKKTGAFFGGAAGSAVASVIQGRPLFGIIPI